MLIDFLRDRARRAAAFVLFALIFRAVYALYRLPGEPYLYALALCLLAGLIAAAADFARYRARRRAIRDLLDRFDAPPCELPEPDGRFEADCFALIRAQSEALRAESARSARERASLTEYYTLWTHQVKTPIAAMRLILQRGDGEDARDLRAELFSIERYVDMALCYSRLDGDSSDLVVRAHDLDAIVRQAVRRYAPAFIRKRLRLELSPIDARVLTDEKWLCFAVEQVLSNAVKYTDRGTVSIFAEAGPALVVRDTGAGIAPEDLPRVFDRGFTGLNGRADKRATGLGLYLTKRVLDRLGHGIRVASEPGRGTEVRIDLAPRAIDTRD